MRNRIGVRTRSWRSYKLMRKGPSQPSLIRLRQAFSLLELFIVITIIGVLVGLLLPILQQTRGCGSVRATCLNNVRQVVLSSHNYASANEMFPTGSRILDEGVGKSFIVNLLPFMDHDHLYKEHRRIWDTLGVGPALDKLSEQQIPVLLCPSSTRSFEYSAPKKTPEQFTSHYIGSLGPNSDPDNVGYRFAYTSDGANLPAIGLQGIFSPRSEDPFDPNVPARFGKGFSFSDCADGASNTIALFESSQSDKRLPRKGWAFGHVRLKDDSNIKHIFSARSVTAQINSKSNSANWNSQPFGSNHPGGCNVAMVDGSSRFISEELDMAVLRAASSMNDGVEVDRLDP